MTKPTGKGLLSCLTRTKATPVSPITPAPYVDPLWELISIESFPTDLLPTLESVERQVETLTQLLKIHTGFIAPLSQQLWHKGTCFRAYWGFHLSSDGYITFEDLFCDYRQAKNRNRCWAAMFICASFSPGESNVKIAVLDSENRCQSGCYTLSLVHDRLQTHEHWLTPFLATRLITQVRKVQAFETLLSELEQVVV